LIDPAETPPVKVSFPLNDRKDGDGMHVVIEYVLLRSGIGYSVRQEWNQLRESSLVQVETEKHFGLNHLSFKPR
jgi:hypothetical protein